MDVDQTTGDVYATIDLAANRQIVKVPWTGNPGGDPATLTRFGPEFKDASNVTQLTLSGTLWGVSIDPKTKDMYVTTDVSGVGEIHVISPVGVWLKKFATDGVTARGSAFSDDGMKFAVAWYRTQRVYDAGAKLYSRNLNGTPTDFSDDTWDFAADLVSIAAFSGIGDHTDWVSSPRDVAFDRNGDVLMCGASHFLYRYSGNAPYAIKEQYLYSDRRGVSRYGVDTDSAGNAYVVANSDGDLAKRFWGLAPDGTPILKVDIASLGSYDANPYCLAYDRLHDRVLVTGKDSTGNHAVLDSYSVTPFTPALDTLSGTVRDSATNLTIAGASVGFAAFALASTWQTTILQGNLQDSATNASGAYSLPITPLDTAGSTAPAQALLSVSAPGYLTKRVYRGPFSGNTTVDVTLDKAATNTLTWTALAPLSGDATMMYRSGEESGIFSYTGRWGQRVKMIPDPKGGAFSVAEIGKDSYTGSTGVGTDKCLDNYLSLAVDNKWLFRGQPVSTVWFGVEYLDSTAASAGWDALGVQADFTNFNPAWWAIPVGEISKTAPFTEGYAKRYFRATQVQLGDQVKNTEPNPLDIGADFRITAHKDYDSVAKAYPDYAGPDWIKSVTLSSVPPPAEPGTYATISEAKAAGAGDVILSDKVITGQWNRTVLYVEEQDRSNAIKVVLPQEWALLDQRLGRFARVYGSLLTDANTNEKYILADSWSDDSFTVPGELPALWANSQALGDTAKLPSMLAHKVGVAGRATGIQEGYFLVDDGGGNLVGVLLQSGLGLSVPSDGDFVTVTGIAVTDPGVPNSTRVVKPYAAGNIEIVEDVP